MPDSPQLTSTYCEQETQTVKVYCFGDRDADMHCAPTGQTQTPATHNRYLKET
jgi:hypothetical protein